MTIKLDKLGACTADHEDIPEDGPHVRHFRAGDVVPWWVLIAEHPGRQGECTFCTDVTITHHGLPHIPAGPVIVRGHLSEGGRFVRIRIPAHRCGEQHKFLGAPTYWVNSSRVKNGVGIEIVQERTLRMDPEAARAAGMGFPTAAMMKLGVAFNAFEDLTPDGRWMFYGCMTPQGFKLPSYLEEIR